MHVDFDAMFRSLAPSDAEVLRQEMRDKLNDAQSGLLTYGETAREGDVCVMGIAPMILELRLDDYEHFDEAEQRFNSRKIRLYFSEPAAVEGSLVMLSLRSKMPGPLGLAEQNRHAKEAERFAYEHGTHENIV